MNTKNKNDNKIQELTPYNSKNSVDSNNLNSIVNK